MTHPLFTRKRIGLFLTASGLLLAIYGAFWKLAADAAVSRYMDWVTAQKEGGVQISTARPVVHGFPLRIDLEIGDVKLEKPGELKLFLANLHVRMRPWSPFRPTLSGGYQSTIALLDRNQSYTLNGFRVRIVQPWIAPRKASDNALFVYVQAEGLTLDPGLQSGLDNEIQSLAFNARIKGSVPDFTSLASLDSWRKAGGTIDLPKIDVTWKPLVISAEGSLALDADLQPRAAFTTHMAGHMQTVDKLAERGEIRPLAASLFRAALRLLEDKDASKDGIRRIRVPITVKDSMVSVAGIKVMRWGAAALPPPAETSQATSPAELEDDEAPPGEAAAIPAAPASTPPSLTPPALAVTPPPQGPNQAPSQ